MPAAAGTKPLKKLRPGMGLYQVMRMESKAPDKSKPWAVVNLETGDVNGRWHASKEEALAQARAMYASMGDKAKVHGEDVIHNAFFLFADAATLVQAGEGVKWIEAIAPKTYSTPAYGDVVVTEQTIDNFIRNINTNIRGQDIAINYEHGIDPSKGLKAAGWIKGARRNDLTGKLELGIDFTEPAKQEIRNGEWKYFSLEWDDEWMHPDGLFYQDVVMGGALTNRPVAKGLMPINFSEIFDEKEQLDAKIMTGAHLKHDDEPEYEFAVWSTAYVNSLPDSCFLYIDSSGGRHLPYKDKSGKIDMPHLRNAAARLNQVKGMSDAVAARIRAKIERLLGTKNASELAAVDAEMNLSEAEMEHSEPGRSNPPPPRTYESQRDEPDRTEGWRRDTPPFDDPPQTGDPYKDVTVHFSEAEAVGYLQASIPGLKRIHTNTGDDLIERIERILATKSEVRSFNELQILTNEVRTYLRTTNGTGSTSDIPEGGYTVGELTDRDLRELRNVLDVDDDGKIVDAVKTKFGELAALRDSISASDQERLFAEQYPQFYEQVQDLTRENRKNTAHKFSESVSRIKKAEGLGLKTTTQGLSTSVLEQIEEVHVKFAENRATAEDFENVVKAIVHGGIVNFGELGSSKDEDVVEVDTTTLNGVANSRRVFAEQVAKWQREHPEESDYLAAVREVSKKFPDLAEAYKHALPA